MEEVKLPTYYRIVADNVRDISAFKLTISEARIKNVVVVADIVFVSEANFKMLDELGIKYIMPLKHNSSLFDTKENSPSMEGKRRGGEHYRRPKYGCKWIFWTKNTVIYQIMHDYPSKHDIINHILDGGTI